MATLTVDYNNTNRTAPVEFVSSDTGTNTVTITINFNAPGKLSDVQALFPSGDTFAANLDWTGDATHTDDIYATTTSPFAGLSGRAFQAGQILVLSVTGGTSGPKAISGQIEQHRAG